MRWFRKSPAPDERHDPRVSRIALEVQVRIADCLKGVSPAQWDALANPAAADPTGHSAETHNPFVSHAFLSALEDSGCVGGRSGWQPVHVLVEARRRRGRRRCALLREVP